jgi:hypothetical protein
MASASSSTDVLYGFKLIQVDTMSGDEIVIRLPSSALVRELHEDIARIERIAPESFRLIYNGQVLDPTSRLSSCIEASEAHVTRVRISDSYEDEHKRCISCLEPFPFWATELVCRKCWHQQVFAARALEAGQPSSALSSDDED